MAQTRGSYGLEVNQAGALLDHQENRERLRWLFRDGTLISNDWGPGNPGDFDHGGWHILCHLAGGSGVFRGPRGVGWLGITHAGNEDRYIASITYRDPTAVQTRPLTDPEAAAWLMDAACVGFIEGTSLGHISARGVRDAQDAFNGWPRQIFDQDVSSGANGGTVWEHWSTTRDLRPTNPIGSSVLQAWLTLVSKLGGRFVAAVARGRREHSHPRQLVELVRAGVLTAEEATWDITPDPIPEPVQRLLYEARPADALMAAEQLPFDAARQRYYMFQRRIARWSSAASVKRDLAQY